MRGGDHQFDQGQRRLHQAVVLSRVIDDLIEHTLVVLAGEHLVTAGDDVATRKSLHSSPSTRASLRGDPVTTPNPRSHRTPSVPEIGDTFRHVGEWNQ